MSYILDALKKMDKERAQASESRRRTAIAGQLAPSPAAGRGGWGRTALVAGVVAIVTLTGSWFLFKGDSGRKSRLALTASSVAPPVTPPPVPATPPSPAPSQSSPAALPVPVTAPLSASPPVPVISPPTASVPAQPAPQQQVPSAAQSAPDNAQEEAETRSSASRSSRASRAGRVSNRAAVPVLTPAATSSAAPPPADLKVTGIAWQDERSARRAVVNGFLLREGAVVGGAKILEIRQDRVRFSLEGRNFEISLPYSGLSSSPPR